MDRYQALEIMMASKQELLCQLQEECSVMEAEMDVLRPELNIPKGFRFLDLPRELRDEVYRFCVAPHTIFLRPRHDYDIRFEKRDQFWKPVWQLLGVSPQIRNEAAKILLSENLIILSADRDQRLLRTPGLEGITSQIYEDGQRSISLQNLSEKYLTSLSLNFSPDNRLEPIKLAARGRGVDDWSNLTDEERTLVSHKNI